MTLLLNTARCIALGVMLASGAPMIVMAAQPATTAPVPAPQQSAQKLVQSFYDQLVDTMKQGDALGFGGRYHKLAPVIQSSFNLPLMTRFAVGPAWAKASPAEQEQLVNAFSQFSIATYASRFPRFDGESFAVLEEKPAPGGGTLVITQLKPSGDEPVNLNYLVRPDDKGQLRIVDVYLDASISELATRRSEFSGIVKSEGFTALADKLTQKTKQLGPT
jgi:phospholipid transport system substrate-binding protein